MGRRTLLQHLTDLWGDDHSIHHLDLDIEQKWKKQQRNYEKSVDSETEGLLFSSPSSPGLSLLYTLWMTFRPSLLKVILLRLSADLLSIFGLFTLRWAVLFCEKQPVFEWAGYVYALVILGSAFCYAVSQHLLGRLSRKTAASAHAALSGALYRQVVPPHQTHSAAPVSQMLAEVDQIAELVVHLPWLISFPVRVVLCVGILWIELGPAMLVGPALLLFLTPVHSSLEHRIKLLQCSQVTIREASENLIKEMLHEMKALKLLAWEFFFQYRVAEAWERELETLQVLGYLTSFSMLSRICIPYLVCLSSLGAFVLMDDGNVLTPSQVFMSLCLFRLLLPLFLKLHTLSTMLKQTKQSLCHLEEFFISENLDIKNCHPCPSQDSPCRFPQHCGRCNNKNHHETERDIEQLPAHKGIGGALGQYLRAFGFHWVILTLLAQLGVCIVCVAQDGLLCVWTAEAKDVQGLEEWKELRNSRLSVCILLGLLQALLVCWAAYCLNCGSLRASHSLQCELLSSVLRLPLSVHLTTDPPHLLRTFTQDMYVIEEQLPEQLHTWGSCLLQIMASMLLIIYIIPVFSLALCPLTFLFFTVQSHCSSVQEHVTYMSSILSPVCVKQHSRRPVSPHMSDKTLPEPLAPRHQPRTYKYSTKVLIWKGQWALLRLDIVYAISLFLISLALLDSADSLDAGIIALALAYGFNVREAMHQFTATSAETTRNALMVQRICVYSKMEKEAEWTGGHRAPPGWPQKGELEFIHYGTEAGAITPAFRGLSFSICKGEKVGVVSREKAETDGLISCLFRAVEASCGAVLIDGVNIVSVGLHTLRSHLHLIPQVPVLFSGSLRANVDPFAQCSDAQVWQVLELCQLKEIAQQLQGQLLHSIQPSFTAHSFLSSGQKRLLCLVRALLGKARVLLVEEALLLGDSESEHLLQQLVLTLLPECTVLWLSQNPNSVMHTDRVLVLDAGHAVEFDSPSVLIQQGTLFRQLLQESQRGSV
ncbi:canalicular multispecific organic anion transporter 1 [Colossoma macropomum]|uniref:canalicular multispecific organic anion transporter 1 n=1 Tax=Colossoma macropomum TaxID=42526 RepID=UPI00186406EF|nr:canalicular multispecific organic anion transporter 1 [Colossoma macropomum]